MSYKQYKNPKDKRITIRIDSKTDNRLRKEADKKSIGLSELISDKLQHDRRQKKLNPDQVSCIIESIEGLKKIEEAVTDVEQKKAIQYTRKRIKKLWEC